MSAGQADGQGKRSRDWHWFMKRQKRREERRMMKMSVEYRPIYNRFRGGWET